MFINQVLGFKIGYAMGVTDKTLSVDFKAVSAAADKLHYFKGKQALLDFRACSRVYYVLIKWYKVFSKAITLQEVAQDRFDSYFKVSSIDFEELYKGKTLAKFLESLVTLRSSLSKQAYKELDINISLEDFELLTFIPEPTPIGIGKSRFIYSKVNPVYGIHFYGDEIFNIRVGEMLSLDRMLLDRLQLVTGKEHPLQVGMSKLDLEVAITESGYFLKASSLPLYRSIIVDASTVQETTRQKITSALTNSNTQVRFVIMDSILSKVRQEENEEKEQAGQTSVSTSNAHQPNTGESSSNQAGDLSFPASLREAQGASEASTMVLRSEATDIMTNQVAVITHKESIIYQIVNNHPHTDVIAEMPISRKLYAMIKSGEFRNAYILSEY